MEFGQKIRGFFVEPTKTFKHVEREHYKDFLTYFAVMSIIPAVLYGVILYLGLGKFVPKLGTNPILVMVYSYIAMWVGLFIGGAWTHIWLLIMGYKGKLEDTYRATVYSLTPSYLLGWIPIVNFFTSVWSAILFIFGASEYGKIEWWKTLIALILAAVIPLIVVVFFVGLALVSTLV